MIPQELTAERPNYTTRHGQRLIYCRNGVIGWESSVYGSSTNIPKDLALNSIVTVDGITSTGENLGVRILYRNVLGEMTISSRWLHPNHFMEI